jgi:hypothetical protein
MRGERAPQIRLHASRASRRVRLGLESACIPWRCATLHHSIAFFQLLFGVHACDNSPGLAAMASRDLAFLRDTPLGKALGRTVSSLENRSLTRWRCPRHVVQEQVSPSGMRAARVPACCQLRVIGISSWCRTSAEGRGTQPESLVGGVLNSRCAEHKTGVLLHLKHRVRQTSFHARTPLQYR